MLSEADRKIPERNGEVPSLRPDHDDQRCRAEGDDAIEVQRRAQAGGMSNAPFALGLAVHDLGHAVVGLRRCGIAQQLLRPLAHLKPRTGRAGED